MNDQYISTEALNKKLDEAYNTAIDHAKRIIESLPKLSQIEAHDDIGVSPPLITWVKKTELISKLEQLKKHS